MNSVAEAINTLVSAANVAHGKGAYSLEEAHYIYLAIDYLNKLQGEQQPQAPQQAPQAPQPTQEQPSQEVVETQGTDSGNQTSEY